MASCASDRNWFEKDEEFQKMKGFYEPLGLTDRVLALKLRTYRTRNNLDVGWYPHTKEEYAAFYEAIDMGLKSIHGKDDTPYTSAADVKKLIGSMYDEYTRQELEDRVQLLAGRFSDKLDELSKQNPDKSRKELIKMKAKEGVSGFVVIMKEVFNDIKKDYSAERLREAYARAFPDATEEQKEQNERSIEYVQDEIDYLETQAEYVTKLAAKRVASNEGMKFNPKDYEFDYRYAEELDAEGDDDTNQAEAGDERTEDTGEDSSEKLKGDRYADYRTAKLMENLAGAAKRIIRNIPFLDSKGNPVGTDLWTIRKLDPRTVAVALHEILYTATPENMMKKLADAAIEKPWLKGLVNHLERYKDDQAVIYSNFKKVRSIYTYNLLEQGQYKQHVANSKTAGRAMAQQAGSNMQSGIVLGDGRYSLYDDNGNLRSSTQAEAKEFRAKIDETIPKAKESPAADYQPDRYTHYTSWIEGANMVVDGEKFKKDRPNPKEAMENYVKENKEVLEHYAAWLRGVGFNVTAEQLGFAIKHEMTIREWNRMVDYVVRDRQVRRNRLAIIHDALETIMDGVDNIMRWGDMTARHLYNLHTEQFARISDALAPLSSQEYVERVIENGKGLTTSTTPNLLHQVFDRLANPEGLSYSEYVAMVKEELFKYEGFTSDVMSEDGIPFGLWSWLLADVTKTPGFFNSTTGYSPEAKARYVERRRTQQLVERLGTTFTVYDKTNFNHVEYAKLSPQQKLIAVYAEFLRGTIEVNIQSDYENAFNFIKLPHFSEDEIRKALMHEVYCELERMNAVRQRSRYDKSFGDDKKPHRAKPTVYEGGCREFQVFPEFNENGFLDEYIKASENDKEAVVEKFVNEAVDNLLKNGRKYMKDMGMFSNPYLKTIDGAIGTYSEDGTYEKLDDMHKENVDEFILNEFYGRQQITKILTAGAGLAAYDGVFDFEKRFMAPHATRIPIYTEATWNNEPVFEKDTQTVVYMEDDVAKSAYVEQMNELIDSLTTKEDTGVISRAQADSYKAMIAKSIKDTDGFALRSLDSHRQIMIGAGKWNSTLETAYQNIKAKKATEADIAQFLGIQKLVYTGYEEIKPCKEAVREGEKDFQKPIKLPVLLKYSEGVLLPAELMNASQLAKTVPYQALDKVQRAQNVDLFIFNSGVKTSCHSSLNPFAKDALGNRLLTTPDEIASFMNGEMDLNSFYKHELPIKYLGIAAATPIHGAGNEIAMAAQAEKQCWGNVRDDDTMVVRGVEMKTVDGRKMFYEIKAARILAMYRTIKQMFADSVELEKAFQEEIASREYSSRELEACLRALFHSTFTLPLYTPSIAHEVEALLLSIIKKRMTKIHSKGANILQAPGLGLELDDRELTSFTTENAIGDDEKLKIEFDRDAKGRLRIKYVEAYITLHDERLKRFADKNGMITANRMEQLVGEGIIPESILNFIAYRTPSDAEHSIIPCRIKGILTNIGGEMIILPKEIMRMTGHDYDGDKLRCHFMDFSVETDEVALNDFVEKHSRITSRGIRYALPEWMREEGNDVLYSDEDSYKKLLLSDRNSQRERFQKIVPIEYDYSKDKTALDNIPVKKKQLRHSDGSLITEKVDGMPDFRAANNALVELMWSHLTSHAGSARMILPGSFDVTKVFGKTMYLIREVYQQNKMQQLGDAMVRELKWEPSAVSKALRDVPSVYRTLKELSDGQISKLVKAVSGNESPFTVEHSIKSFEYLMAGATMIGIYAMYSSTAAMLQRASDIRYKPLKYKNKKKEEVTLDLVLFGHKIDKLFSVKDRKGRFSLATYSRFVNAAVDNAKDPVLGFLNQTDVLSHITNFLIAAGYDEEDIHLLMNQPAIIELAKRLKRPKAKSVNNTIKELVNELTDVAHTGEKTENQNIQYSFFNSIDKIKNYSTDDFAASLSQSYNGIVEGKNSAHAKKQINMLHFVERLEAPARELTKFVRLMRPDADNGGIESTLSGTIAKYTWLENFRDEHNVMNVDGKYISGFGKYVEKINSDMQTDESLMEAFGDELPEIKAYNTLMLDATMGMLKTYFPQMKPDWLSVIKRIANIYTFDNVNASTVARIVSDMILWKLLGNKRLINGDPQEEQKRMLIDLPKQLSALKKRISDAENDVNTEDRAALALAKNVFLTHLDVVGVKVTRNGAQRIRFLMNAGAVEGFADDVKMAWNDMLKSSDESIRQMAIDLFKYNLYTNGFSYGLYEFYHFAPLTLLEKVPGYINTLDDILGVYGKGALNSVLESDWSDADDLENFIHQYCMNHWGDYRFLPEVRQEQLPENIRKMLGFTLASSEQNRVELGEDLMYFVLSTKNNGNDARTNPRTHTLYRINRAPDGKIIGIEIAQKLGIRNRFSQVIEQYNPTVGYRDVKAIIAGNEYYWGEHDEVRDVVTKKTERINGDEFYELQQEYMSSRVPISSVSLNDLAMAAFRSGTGLNTSSLDAMEAAMKTNDMPDDLEEVTSGQPVTAETEAAPVEEGTMFDITDDRGASFSFVMPESIFGKKNLQIVTRNPDGTLSTKMYPATPWAVNEARRQKVFVTLHKRLEEILQKKGVPVGVLSALEERLRLGGVTDFDTARVAAEGFKVMIRLSSNQEVADIAIPEEFAHAALAMLGMENKLVKRLVEGLRNNPEELRKAFGDDYEKYVRAYDGDNNRLAFEAAGKLVAQQLFLHQAEEIARENGEIDEENNREEPNYGESKFKRLIRRIVESIKDFFRRLFTVEEITEAVVSSEQDASTLARELLGGQLLDSMSQENISETGEYYNMQAAIDEKEKITDKLLKNLQKRASLLKRRMSESARESSASLTATEAMISLLEEQILNAKTEEAVLSFLNGSYKFLADMEVSFKEALKNADTNSVCGKLNIVRDTLFGIAKSLEDIRLAIKDNEIIDNVGLKSTLDMVSGMVTSFFMEYNEQAVKMFEDMLSSVYGKEGVTVTIGRQRGRKITIHEMATHADGDVGFMKRWFYSLADAPDFALKAIDDVVRSAKQRARRRAEEMRPELEVAVYNLKQKTGSTDQSWMFERKLVNGKLKKTGLYIDEETAKSLGEAKYEFYKTVMKLKAKAEQYIPEGRRSPLKMIMLRKYSLQKVKDAETLKEKGVAAWEGIKDTVRDDRDIDFDEENVIVDFENTRVDKLVLKYLEKGKDESYEDMSEDVATSLMAFIGMATEYGEMNNIVAMLENAKYMAAQRNVQQKSGTRTQIESVDKVSEEGQYYREPFTKKQAITSLQDMLEDFFQMHVYGHIAKDESTFGHTNISKRKVVNAINAVTTYSQMALNIPQRVANVNTGLVQILIETAAKGKFNAKDVAWATRQWTKHSGDRLADVGKTDYDNYLSLWMDRFDVHQDNGRHLMNREYARSRAGRTFNSNLLFAGLNIGEDYLAAVTALAVARNYKVKDASGNVHNLFEAYEVRYKDSANKTGAYLALKDGWTKEDGSAITEQDELAFTKEVASMNFEMQGIYNLDDRSAVQQYALGALVIMYRKWIAPAIKRRYEGLFSENPNYNLMKGQFEEGYWTTMFHWMVDSVRDARNDEKNIAEGTAPVSDEESVGFIVRLVDEMKAIISSLKLNYGKMSEYEKANMKKCITEFCTVMGLMFSSMLLSKIKFRDPDEDPLLSWADNFVFCQLLRLRTELSSIAPTPMMVKEGLKILNSPFAAIEPIMATLNLVQFLIPSNYSEEIKSGKYKGHSKAYKYFRELPYISMIKKVNNFLDPSPMINYYKSER